MDWNDFTLITVPALITLFGVLITISVQSKNHINQINASFEVEKKRSFYNNKLLVYENVSRLSSSFLTIADKVKFSTANYFFTDIGRLANELETVINTKLIYIPAELQDITSDLIKYSNRIALVYGQENDFDLKINMVAELCDVFRKSHFALIEFIQQEYQS